MVSISRPSAVVATEAPLVHVAFSRSASQFVACTATGLHVFSCDGSVERVHYRGLVASGGGEVTSAELLTRSYLAVVIRRPDAADGAADVYTIHLLDGRRGETVAVKPLPLDIPDLGAVGGVRLLEDHVLVAGEEKAMLVLNGDHRNRKNEDVKATGPNPLGLCALAIDQATLVYAVPREEKGAVQVCRSGSHDSVDVHAHESRVACIALSRDGRLLATAGSKGTLVRIFSTHDGSKLQELRRGADRADIHCTAFSPDSKWLAVSSDKATVHVFRVADFNHASSTPESGVERKHNAPEESGQAVPAAAPPAASPPPPAKANQGSSLSFLKGYLPSYFSSEWSLAQYRLPEGVKYSVAFGRQQPNTVLIIGTDGSYYRCLFDPVNAGDMVQVEHKKFMKIK